MGLFKDIINGTKQLYKLKEGEYKGDIEQMYQASGELMRLLHNQAPGVNHTPIPFKDFEMVSLVGGRNEPSFGTAQATYLMPRDAQRQKFLETGYIDGSPGDYGLVKKAVGKRNLPVFQTAPDSITRDELIPIGNTGINKNKYFSESYFPIGVEKELFNAGRVLLLCDCLRATHRLEQKTTGRPEHPCRETSQRNHLLPETQRRA